MAGLQDFIHDTLEGRGRISKPKRNYQGLIMAFMTSESSLQNIFVEITKTTERGGGGMNQLLLCLNNFKSIKPFLIFHQVTINIIHHMNNINNEHQSHIRYTQRQIFHEETHKGRKPLLLRNDRQSFKFCTSSMFEHQLKVRLLPLFYKLQLVESTNSLVSLAPTRRKHQLPKSSSTNWMEAPTS
jgi:hypothetical protein